MLTEQEAGLPTAELRRKHGLSPAALHKLRAKYGVMDLFDANRLKQLEDESARLKCLVADVMLDNVVLKDLLEKPSRRAIARHLSEHNGEACNGGTLRCGR